MNMDINALTERAVKIKSLYADFENKKNYKEWTTEETFNGLVSDVGDLGRLILAKEGFREMPDLEKNLKHELAEILWAVLVFSKQYNIDLTEAFVEEMDRLEKTLVK